MTIIVKDKMGTRYIIDSLSSKFENILIQAARDNYTVDLADCKLGPTAASCLRDFYKTLDIINSKDSVLNGILMENKEISNIVYDEYPVLNMNVYPNLQDFSKIYKELEAGSKYKFRLENNKHTAMATLLILSRPDVEFDLYDSGISIYEFVSHEWEKMQEEHEEYIEFTAPGIRKIVVNNGLVKTVTGNSVAIDLYIQKYNVLPASFGRDMLLKTTDSGIPIGEWKDVVLKCMKMLTTLTVKKETLRRYLKVRS